MKDFSYKILPLCYPCQAKLLADGRTAKPLPNKPTEKTACAVCGKKAQCSPCWVSLASPK